MQSQTVKVRQMKDGVNPFLLLLLIFTGVVICFGSTYLLSLLGLSLGVSVAMVYGVILMFAFVRYRNKRQREEQYINKQRRLKSRASIAVELGVVPVIVSQESDWQISAVPDQQSVVSNRLNFAEVD